jgi:hypothetical protein
VQGDQLTRGSERLQITQFGALPVPYGKTGFGLQAFGRAGSKS